MDEILKILATNGRESIKNIARMLNCSEAEAQEKMGDFEKKGIILGYQAIINEEKLNLKRVTAIIEVKVTPEREGGFDYLAERIGNFPEVISLFLMSGNYDLLLFIEGDNLRGIASFVSEKLATIPGVTSTLTHFMLKTYKHHGVKMENANEQERLKVSP